ncbi:UDP-N-acetylmuramate dehydrogenase [Mesoaciditoga sp.]
MASESELSVLTTFRMAGKVKKLLKPASVNELAEIIQAFHENGEYFKIIGGGSNTIIRDGISVPLVSTLHLKRMRFDGNYIFAESGVSLSKIISEAEKRGLSGLEFASGIPGTIGGAVFMNSGAFGGEISNRLQSIVVVNKRGEVKELRAGEVEFSYRSSSFHSEDMWIAGCVLKLQYSTPLKVKTKVEKFFEMKKNSQPLNMPSVGCIFKNPENDYAARLIDAAGLKGFKVGGVMVSKKHAGFFVNVGKATFEDFKSVYMRVLKEVKEKLGVELEPEITIVW